MEQRPNGDFFIMDKVKIICEIKEIISKRCGIMTITKKQNKKFENIRSYII